MQKAQGFRHELKYGIDPFSYLVLRQRLSTVMRRDSHAGTDGRYQIVSLYFDNCCDKALREKQDGINRREYVYKRQGNGVGGADHRRHRHFLRYCAGGAVQPAFVFAFAQDRRLAGGAGICDPFSRGGGNICTVRHWLFDFTGL